MMVNSTCKVDLHTHTHTHTSSDVYISVVDITQLLLEFISRNVIRRYASKALNK